MQTFFRVTLPNIKWGLLYGVILCNARAMGEFGAVSVVSGKIRGLTNTLPLHVEILYNEYKFQAAFAVASLLALLALVTLVLKTIVERRARAESARTPDATAVRGHGMGIEVRNVSKTFGSFVALDDVSFTVRAGRARRAARAVRLRQDDAAADHRRARDGRLGHRAVRRRGRDRAERARSRRRASSSSTTRCSGT